MSDEPKTDNELCLSVLSQVLSDVSNKKVEKFFLVSLGRGEGGELTSFAAYNSGNLKPVDLLALGKFADISVYQVLSQAMALESREETEKRSHLRDTALADVTPDEEPTPPEAA